MKVYSLEISIKNAAEYKRFIHRSVFKLNLFFFNIAADNQSDFANISNFLITSFCVFIKVVCFIKLSSSFHETFLNNTFVLYHLQLFLLVFISSIQLVASSLESVIDERLVHIKTPTSNFESLF